MIFNTGLTHLGLDASIYWIINENWDIKKSHLIIRSGQGWLFNHLINYKKYLKNKNNQSKLSWDPVTQRKRDYSYNNMWVNVQLLN